MSVDFSDERISAYLDGELTPAERGEIEALLASSAEHRQLVEELRALRTSLQDLPRPQLSAGFSERVMRRALESGAAASDAGNPFRGADAGEVGGGATSGGSDLGAVSLRHSLELRRWRIAFWSASSVAASLLGLLIYVGADRAMSVAGPTAYVGGAAPASDTMFAAKVVDPATEAVALRDAAPGGLEMANVAPTGAAMGAPAGPALGGGAGAAGPAPGDGGFPAPRRGAAAPERAKDAVPDSADFPPAPAPADSQLAELKARAFRKEVAPRAMEAPAPPRTSGEPRVGGARGGGAIESPPSETPDAGGPPQAAAPGRFVRNAEDAVEKASSADKLPIDAAAQNGVPLQGAGRALQRSEAAKTYVVRVVMPDDRTVAEATRRMLETKSAADERRDRQVAKNEEAERDAKQQAPADRPNVVDGKPAGGDADAGANRLRESNAGAEEFQVLRLRTTRSRARELVKSAGAGSARLQVYSLEVPEVELRRRLEERDAAKAKARGTQAAAEASPTGGARSDQKAKPEAGRPVVAQRPGNGGEQEEKLSKANDDATRVEQGAAALDLLAPAPATRKRDEPSTKAGPKENPKPASGGAAGKGIDGGKPGENPPAATEAPASDAPATEPGADEDGEIVEVILVLERLPARVFPAAPAGKPAPTEPPPSNPAK